MPLRKNSTEEQYDPNGAYNFYVFVHERECFICKKTKKILQFVNHKRHNDPPVRICKDCFLDIYESQMKDYESTKTNE